MSAEVVDHITERLVAIWRDLTKVPDIDADTDLFDIGATSLTAVRIRSRVRAELGKEIELVDLLEHPTPRELAAVVATAEIWHGQTWQQLDWSSD
ncbi:acyl carrier protein [Plantactinospora mayteni]|uniref:acyl carrier protein n=1 Tax=Plantactinospora mayteni TaxID=566021 RepID=UPI0019413847|nr:acyl carrier protein [Plantactinospora mayteni]